MRRFIQTPDWSPGYIHVCPRHVSIRVKCLGCHAERDFDREALPPRLQHALVEKIEAKLKCSSCGAKNGKLLFGHWSEGG